MGGGAVGFSCLFEAGKQEGDWAGVGGGGAEPAWMNKAVDRHARQRSEVPFLHGCNKMLRNYSGTLKWDQIS